MDDPRHAVVLDASVVRPPQQVDCNRSLTARAGLAVAAALEAIGAVGSWTAGLFGRWPKGGGQDRMLGSEIPTYSLRERGSKSTR